MSVVPQLPQTTLQYLNLVSTRLLCSVRQDAVGRDLTCFMKSKADKSFLHSLSTCLSHFNLSLIVTPPVAQFGRPFQYCDLGYLYQECNSYVKGYTLIQ